MGRVGGAIHSLLFARNEVVDGPAKPGHDTVGTVAASNDAFIRGDLRTFAFPSFFPADRTLRPGWP
jgi:hypothetical protein